MRREPSVREDGTCALRGCVQPLPRMAVLHGDPFHSSECSRTFHGVVFSRDGAGRNMKRTPNDAQRRFASENRR